MSDTIRDFMIHSAVSGCLTAIEEITGSDIKHERIAEIHALLPKQEEAEAFQNEMQAIVGVLIVRGSAQGGEPMIDYMAELFSMYASALSAVVKTLSASELGLPEHDA